MKKEILDDIDDGAAFLQQLDPRLKLVLSIIVIATVFATTSWVRLIVLAFLVFCLVRKLSAVAELKQRLFWLRWFFVAIIVLHTLMSPGYTLLGIPWLSADGFMQGVMISVQIVVALSVSIFLMKSSTADQIAIALNSALSPLRFFGLNVQHFVGQILLALDFVPILRQESTEALRRVKQEAQVTDYAGLEGRIRKLNSLIIPVITNLLNRADTMAHRSATENHSDDIKTPIPPFFPLAGNNMVAILLFAPTYVICLLLP